MKKLFFIFLFCISISPIQSAPSGGESVAGTVYSCVKDGVRYYSSKPKLGCDTLRTIPYSFISKPAVKKDLSAKNSEIEIFNGNVQGNNVLDSTAGSSGAAHAAAQNGVSNQNNIQDKNKNAGFFAWCMQIVVLSTILAQFYVAIKSVFAVRNSERFVRAFAFATGVLIFLGSFVLGITFADLIVIARLDESLLKYISIGIIIPIVVGMAVTEMTIRALRYGGYRFIRVLLMVAAFTLCQVIYTNYQAFHQEGFFSGESFVSNICYSIAVGVWLIFRHEPDKNAMDSWE